MKRDGSPGDRNAAATRDCRRCHACVQAGPDGDWSMVDATMRAIVIKSHLFRMA
jgi:hypothetical protein